MTATTDREQQLRRRLETVIGTPFTEGNAVTVLRNGDEIFPAMLEAIRGAESTVDLCTFVYWQGDIAVEFAEAMSARAEAGVRVRLLIDALGGRLIDKTLVDADGRGRGAGRVVPQAPGEVAVQVQPPTAPQGLHRRRTGRLHRRRRHRGGVVRRRAQRERVAGHPPARRRARRSTACSRRSSRTGPRPAVRCSTSATSSPSSRSGVTRPSRSPVAPPRSAGTTCSRRST